MHWKKDPSGVNHCCGWGEGDLNVAFAAAQEAIATRPEGPCWFWWNDTPAPMTPNDTAASLYARWAGWREGCRCPLADLLFAWSETPISERPERETVSERAIAMTRERAILQLRGFLGYATATASVRVRAPGETQSVSVRSLIFTSEDIAALQATLAMVTPVVRG